MTKKQYTFRPAHQSHQYGHLLMLAVLILGMTGCGASSPYYRHAEERPVTQEEELSVRPGQFTLFFIGDTGDPATDPLEPNLKVLRHQLEEAGEHSVVVFLGDNIYTHGLLPEDHPERSDSERRIDAQLQILEEYQGHAIFTPGNHDWNSDEPGGLEAIQRQQNYIESKLSNPSTFLPDNGCPGPVEVKLDTSNVLLLLDTEWWLYPHNKPGLKSCPNGSEEQFIQAVDSLVQHHRARNLFVAGHHPMYSNGTHAGNASLTTHLFPLLDVSPVLYVPLPVIGSVNSLYRKYIGYRQDLAGRQYKRLRKRLVPIFQQHPRLVYASGHDHSLQYHPVDNQHYIVSGGGTVKSFVRRGKTAAFAYAHKGFARITINGQKTMLTFWTPESDYPQGKLMYRSVLFTNQ